MYLANDQDVVVGKCVNRKKELQLPMWSPPPRATPGVRPLSERHPAHNVPWNDWGYPDLLLRGDNDWEGPHSRGTFSLRKIDDRRPKKPKKTERLMSDIIEPHHSHS